jgi:L-lactate dehydrogenase complex protein LldG
MKARERILARVRTARQTGDETIGNTPVSYPRPATGADLSSHFAVGATRLGSEVAHVDQLSAVPATVAHYLAAAKLPPQAVCWPQLANLPWAAHGMQIEVRAARGDDLIGVTATFCAVAETGTLMLLSGPLTAATVSLLPETHIAVVTRAEVVPTMEAAWARLRAAGGMPRAVNFISGPSRTADVEQTVTLGAHGPRNVLVVLVDG